jgi:pimeloyl-ACP methyl ester carboxylesterase
MCGISGSKGIATLAIDMHGHGSSGGERYYVKMTEWVADIRAAIDFLQTQPKIDGNRIGAFGLSSGGTAILEAAIIDTRLKSLVALDSTVRNSLSASETLLFKSLAMLGSIKMSITGKDLRVPLAKMGSFHLASDPVLDHELQTNPRTLVAFMSFPFPGATEAFFVDTLKRVPQIKAPTLVLWGEDDQLDSPETARLLYAALTCQKEIHIIPGNGHVGHLDRNKATTFALTADWLLKTL